MSEKIGDERLDAIARSIAEMVRESCERYKSENGSKAVSNVGLWTSGCCTVSVFSIETVAHLKSFTEEWLSRYNRGRDDNFAVQVAELTAGGYNGSAGNYEFNEYGVLRHHDLPSYFAKLGYTDPSSIESAVEQMLLDARKICVENRSFDLLPSTGSIWIGSSSPMKWYDHLEKYAIEV